MKTKWLIIGSGPGSASAAHVLSQHFGEEVMLIEEGSDPKNISIKPNTLSEMRHFMKNSGLNYVLGSPPLILSEAKVLGGGSEINSGIYWSLPHELRQKWESEFKMTNFGITELFPFQKMAEEILEIHQGQPEDDFFQRMKTEALKSGFAWLSPHVWWNPDSRGGLRNKILSPCEKKGMKILTGVKAQSIKRTASGWKVETSLETIDCEKLVVGAGLFTTQKLLSSWCPSQKIFFHPQVRVLASFPGMKKRDYDSIPSFQFKKEKTTLGFSSNKPNHLLGLFGHSPDMMKSLEDKTSEIISIYGSVSVDSSIQKIMGKMRWVSWQKKDQKKLLDVMQETIHLVKQMGAQEFLPVTKSPQWNRSKFSFSDLKLTSVHLMGGLGMGESPRCQSDSFGRVKAAKNLYVSDASLMNGPLGVNPQGTIMMLSLRNASQWIRD